MSATAKDTKSALNKNTTSNSELNSAANTSASLDATVTPTSAGDKSAVVDPNMASNSVNAASNPAIEPKAIKELSDYEKLTTFINEGEVRPCDLLLPGAIINNYKNYSWLEGRYRYNYLEGLFYRWPSFVQDNFLNIVQLIAKKNAVGDLNHLLKGFFQAQKMLESYFYGSPERTKIKDETPLFSALQQASDYFMQQAGGSLLVSCVILGCEKSAEYLLTREVSASAALLCGRYKGQTVFDVALYCGSANMIKLLLKWGGVTNKDKIDLFSAVNRAGFGYGRNTRKDCPSLLTYFVNELQVTTLFPKLPPKEAEKRLRNPMDLYGCLSEASRVFPSMIPFLLEYGAGLVNKQYRICKANNHNPEYARNIIKACESIQNFDIKTFLEAEIVLLGRNREDKLIFIYELKTLKEAITSAVTATASKSAITIKLNTILNHVLNADPSLLEPGVFDLFYNFVKSKAFNVAIPHCQGLKENPLLFGKINPNFTNIIKFILPFFDIPPGKAIESAMSEGIKLAEKKIVSAATLTHAYSAASKVSMAVHANANSNANSSASSTSAVQTATSAQTDNRKPMTK